MQAAFISLCVLRLTCAPGKDSQRCGTYFILSFHADSDITAFGPLSNEITLDLGVKEKSPKLKFGHR